MGLSYCKPKCPPPVKYCAPKKDCAPPPCKPPPCKISLWSCAPKYDPCPPKFVKCVPGGGELS
jgi:hypothetical protein